jgi:hypothetical protein
MDTKRLQLESHWLKLPTEVSARQYVTSLGLGQKATLILQWAGYHPFLVDSLCKEMKRSCKPDGSDQRSVRTDDKVVEDWKKSDEVQKFLSETYSYLDLEETPDSLMMAKRLLKGESLTYKQLTESEKSGVEYLERRSIVDSEIENAQSRLIRIPSRLVREYLSSELRLRIFDFNPGRLTQVIYMVLALTTFVGLILISFT